MPIVAMCCLFVTKEHQVLLRTFPVSKLHEAIEQFYNSPCWMNVYEIVGIVIKLVC